jgi:hypothetical protein
MRRGIYLGIALALYGVPALAQDSCVVPYAPTVPQGASATREQILSTRDLVMAFIKASDDYQNCLRVYLDQQTQLAAREQRQVDAALRASVLAKADANQREKERTGTELNAAVRAYNTANPAP